MLKKISQRIYFGRKSWDPIDYWSGRAADPSTVSVMWANLVFNQLVDQDEWNLVMRHLPVRRSAVLDLGCGTGRLSARLANEFEQYTGVDMEAMVAEARRRNPSLADRFVGATVETYEFPERAFDLALSLGCVATACSWQKLRDVAPRMVRSVKSGGTLLLIEPFHRNWLLTRGCRTSLGEVVNLFAGLGMRVADVGGMLFPPFRMILSEAAFARTPNVTRLGYRLGEAIVKVHPTYLADYKVVALTKP